MLPASAKQLECADTRPVQRYVISNSFLSSVLILYPPQVAFSSFGSTRRLPRSCSASLRRRAFPDISAAAFYDLLRNDAQRLRPLPSLPLSLSSRDLPPTTRTSPSRPATFSKSATTPRLIGGDDPQLRCNFRRCKVAMSLPGKRPDRLELEVKRAGRLSESEVDRVTELIVVAFNSMFAHTFGYSHLLLPCCDPIVSHADLFSE